MVILVWKVLRSPALPFSIKVWTHSAFKKGWVNNALPLLPNLTLQYKYFHNLIQWHSVALQLCQLVTQDEYQEQTMVINACSLQACHNVTFFQSKAAFVVTTKTLRKISTINISSQVMWLSINYCKTNGKAVKFRIDIRSVMLM